MIRVERAAEPPGFDAEVRQPGALALRELAGDPTVPPRRGPKRKNVPDVWTRALPELRVRYRRTCAYLAMYIHPATGRDTVDHFLPWRADPARRAFEWGNFRYASHEVNRAKGTRRVLDPFEVEDGGFRLNLATFEVEARQPVADSDAEVWRDTLAMLNEPVFRDARAWYHDRYLGIAEGFTAPMPWATLAREAPFVARELERHGLRRPERG